MTMLRDYSHIIAHDVDEDTDDLEPVDPSVFFGIDEDDDADEDDDGLFEDDEDVPETEEDGEY
jgi:hypothetical protein